MQCATNSKYKHEDNAQDILAAVDQLYTLHSLLHVIYYGVFFYQLWWHGTVVECRSMTGELSLSCARPAADG